MMYTLGYLGAVVTLVIVLLLLPLAVYLQGGGRRTGREERALQAEASRPAPLETTAANVVHITPDEERALWHRSAGGNWWPEGLVPPAVPGQPPRPARSMDEFIQQVQQRTRKQDPLP